MAVNEPFFRRMCEQFLKKRIAFCFRHAVDAIGKSLVHVQRLSTRIFVGANDRMQYVFQRGQLNVGKIGSGPGVSFIGFIIDSVRMIGEPAINLLFNLVGERFIRSSHVSKQRGTALVRYLHSVQHRT